MKNAPGLAVLIPSRGRGDLLKKTFDRMPFLKDPDVFIGVEWEERDQYAYLRDMGVTECRYHNHMGSVGVARDRLRSDLFTVMAHYPKRKFTHAIMTDDNARYTEASLYNLFQATVDYEDVHGWPCFMAGMHGTAAHFDRNAIAKGVETVNGRRSYAAVGAIFHCVNTQWLRFYQYPQTCYALEDRHLFMTAISQGHRTFRICMDAPFTKTRYQAGGQGSIPERARKCGLSIARLAGDFPGYVGARGTFPTPWQFIMSMVDGATPDRLVGGAMRKGEQLATQPRKTLTIKRQAR